MKTYRVELTAVADVSTIRYITAETDEQAIRLAVIDGRSGDFVWKYDGVDDSTIEASITDEV